MEEADKWKSLNWKYKIVSFLRILRLHFLLPFSLYRHFIFYRLILFLITFSACWVATLIYAINAAINQTLKDDFPEFVLPMILTIAITMFVLELIFYKRENKGVHKGFEEGAELVAAQIEKFCKGKKRIKCGFGHSLAGGLMARVHGRVKGRVSDILCKSATACQLPC